MSSEPSNPEPSLTADEVRQTRISKLRDKRNQLNDDQWENVLHSTLLQRRTQASEASIFEKLEVLASITGDRLSMVFRNNISAITQKLGEVVFKKDESQEIDIRTWTGTAVERSNELDREVQDLSSKYDEQSRKMEKLNNQLEDLIKAKSEHEDSLLRNFRELLNTKKLKIRDQNRVLASAKLDPKQASKIQGARSISQPHAATPSRAGKRKAKSAHQVSESSEESGFEGKYPKQKPESDLSEQMNTPEHSSQEVTDDETGDEPDSSPPQASKLPGRNEVANGAKGAKSNKMRPEVLPPTRSSPFGEDCRSEETKRPVIEDNSGSIQEARNEDEETDDDEL